MLRNNANFNLMEKVARQVGRSMLRDFDEIRQLQGSVKGVDDFARRAHERAETAIIQQLTGTRPNYGVRSSFHGEHPGNDPTRYWVLSAMDGARNFRHGLPRWALRIALEQKGEIVLAVVFDALNNEMFAAEKGDGSWVDDKRMRVSSRVRLPDIMVEVEMPVGQPVDGECHAVIERISGRVGAVRSSGAPSLDLACLAAGRMDAFFSSRCSEDETSAGRLLLTESGGLHAPWNAEEGQAPYGLVAASGNTFREFEALVRNSH